VKPPPPPAPLLLRRRPRFIRLNEEAPSSLFDAAIGGSYLRNFVVDHVVSIALETIQAAPTTTALCDNG